MKKQKRRFAWKDKHIRKHWTLNKRWRRYGKAPKAYCKPYFKAHRQNERVNCTLLLKGYVEEELFFKYNHHNSASWHYV